MIFRVWNAAWSFSGSVSTVLTFGFGEEGVDVSESEFESGSCFGESLLVRERISYSPVSQMRREPVWWDAVSIRWFCFELIYKS